MGKIEKLAEKLWSGALSTRELHPMATMVAAEELRPGLLFAPSFANVTAIASRAGLVLIDTGGPVFGQHVYHQVRRWCERALHTAIYTHGHIDHVFGLRHYMAERHATDAPAAVVVGHEAVARRFRRYARSAGYNGVINARQFGLPELRWPVDLRAPDRTYRERLDLRVGEEQLELHHARGETDDHSWIWLPRREVLCCGDLFIWATPNCGNPQKVQRYPLEWAAALRRMAGLGARLLLPGHGLPIFGRERIVRALEDAAALLQTIHDQTLALMNRGLPLAQVVARVEVPSELMERPYLRPVYDDPQFIVHNVWREYGGWYDGDPAHLKPAAGARIARELAQLAGGAARLAERGEELAARGLLAEACELLELAVRAEPEDGALWRARAAVYRQRADSEPSLMARGIFAAAAQGTSGLSHK